MISPHAKNRFERRITRQINVGGVLIGNGAPISIQTMTKTKTANVNATVEQIQRSIGAGVDIIRITVNDATAADAMPEIVRRSKVPIVADIHFNHIFALKSIEAGVAKIRINPGNIGSNERIQQVLQKAKEYNIPIRIGVNSGSLEKDILEKYTKPTAEALFESAMRHVSIAQSYDFNDLAISVKSSNVKLMIEAYRMLSEKTDFPLHLGVTEAGTFRTGTVKSCVGIGTLLAEGIGDTIRVSLTDEPEHEVEIAKEILSSLGLRRKGLEIISCPTCGRLELDLFSITRSVEDKLKNVNKNITVAIMGCVVNGPGEASEADIGVACGKDSAILFKRGVKVRKINEEDIVDVIFQEVMGFEEI